MFLTTKAINLIYKQDIKVVKMLKKKKRKKEEGKRYNLKNTETRRLVKFN